MKKKFLDFFLVIASIYVIADVFQLSLPFEGLGKWLFVARRKNKNQ
jgi:hypothetical protein